MLKILWRLWYIVIIWQSSMDDLRRMTRECHMPWICYVLLFKYSRWRIPNIDLHRGGQGPPTSLCTSWSLRGRNQAWSAWWLGHVGAIWTSLLISDICRGCDICAYLSWLSCVLNSVLFNRDHRNLSFADAWCFFWSPHCGIFTMADEDGIRSDLSRVIQLQQGHEIAGRRKKLVACWYMLPHWQLYMLEVFASNG
jgi:hypothetical protein